MNRRPQVAVTITVALLTILFSTLCAAVGIYALADHGVTLDLHPAVGISMVALGVAVWIGSPLLWLLPVGSSERDRMDM